MESGISACWIADPVNQSIMVSAFKDYDPTQCSDGLEILVQIPSIMRKYFSPEAEFTHVRQLSNHEELSIPVTNYGMFPALTNGLIPRVLEPVSALR